MAHECRKLYKNYIIKNVKQYEEIIKKEYYKIPENYGALKFEYIGCDNEKECQKIYQDLGNACNFDIDINDVFISDDENYKDESYTNDILITNPENVYVVYYTGQITRLMLLRILFKTEIDESNERIIKCATFGNHSKNSNELNDCLNELALLNKSQISVNKELTKEKQMETFNEIIKKYYPNDIMLSCEYYKTSSC
jgi:hypothetical protein